MGFEEALQKSMFNQDTEKSFIDKLLSKEEIEKYRTLISKPRLNRAEISVLINLLISSESKVLNYDGNTRYVINKFFIWVSQYAKVAERVFDFDENLKKKEKILNFELNERTKKLYDDFMRGIEGELKFLSGVYLNIGRTSLSEGGTGFYELLKNKFEIQYSQSGFATPEVKNSGFRGG